MRKTLNADAVIDFLDQRKDFDYWWENIDAETQEEILEELEQLIERLIMQ